MDRQGNLSCTPRRDYARDMDINVTTDGKTTTVQLGGNLDLDSAANLAQALEKVLDRKPKQVHIDLSGIRHLSSSGVAILLKFYLALEEAGTGCLISKISPAALRVLDLVGVKDSFKFKT
jgi:anti-sigma B factor antagonist